MWTRTAFCIGMIFLLGSCAGPAEEVDKVGKNVDNPGGDALDQYMNEVNIVIDNPCVEGEHAFFTKVEDDWHFTPCEGCDSRDVELSWGGNTGQHLEMEQTLDAMLADAQGQTISYLQYAQSTGECP